MRNAPEAPTAPLTLGTLADLLGTEPRPFEVVIAIMEAYQNMVPARCCTCHRKLVALLHCCEERIRQAAGRTGDSYYDTCDECVERAPTRGALLRVLRDRAGVWNAFRSNVFHLRESLRVRYVTPATSFPHSLDIVCQTC